jgi:hypothetical protein
MQLMRLQDARKGELLLQLNLVLLDANLEAYLEGENQEEKAYLETIQVGAVVEYQPFILVAKIIRASWVGPYCSRYKPPWDFKRSNYLILSRC